MAALKPEFTPDFQEFDTHEVPNYSNVRPNRLLESVRLGLTVLAVLAGITILSTSAETLSVYNTTHLGDEFFLPLWPSEFDLRPTTALVICGAIIFLVNTVSLVVSKVPAIRNQTFIHRSISFLVPIIGLIAGLVATSFFYGVNASNTVSSLQSWSCQWSAISMDTKPYWGTLCSESKAALYLTVMIIPLEVLVLGTTMWAFFAEKTQPVIDERKGSPALS